VELIIFAVKIIHIIVAYCYHVVCSSPERRGPGVDIRRRDERVHFGSSGRSVLVK
jgi:hypothetical protein